MNKQQKNKGYKQLIYIYISHVNVTQTVPDISPLMPMHQDPLLVEHFELDKGLDMVDKAGVGGKKWISQKWLSNKTNKQIKGPLLPLNSLLVIYIKFYLKW